MAFMFETNLFPKLTQAAMAAPNIDRDYYKCWVGLKQHFDLNEAEKLVLEEQSRLENNKGGFHHQQNNNNNLQRQSPSRSPSRTQAKIENTGLLLS